MHRDVYGGAGARIRSPLVGREGLLKDLGDLYAQARNGAGCVALLWGEAGVGKTRLLEELATTAFAGARIGSATCFEGLCPAFAPLREAFASLQLPPPFAAERTAATPARAQALRYADFVTAVSSLASAAPCVLLLDDLQWADFATLEFLAFFAQRRGDARVAVIATVRSDDIERDHERLIALERALRAGACRFDVAPLPEREMRHLVSSLWPPDVPNLEREIERVCALAEGKPYFAEELVNSALSAVADTRFEQAPLSIRAGVLARFQRLDPQERNILLHAAVIGRNFDPSVLELLAGETPQNVATALARGCDLQLIVAARDEPNAFAFRHAITREILYCELLGPHRRRTHARLATLLEAQSPASDAAHAADHWDAAGDPLRAAASYELAGDRAAARGAHHDAEAAYRMALRRRDDAAATSTLLCEKLSRAHSINGNVEDAIVYLARAVDGYAAAGDTETAAKLAIRLARRQFEAARAADAFASGERSLQLAGGGPAAYEAHVTLAHFFALRGETAEAGERLRLAEEVGGEPSVQRRRDFYMVRAVLRASTGGLAGSFEDYEAAIECARELREPEQLAWALGNYASRALATGHTSAAIARYREAVACASAGDFGKVGTLSAEGLASALMLSGELDAARVVHTSVAGAGNTMVLMQTAQIALALRLAYVADEVLPLDPASLAQAIELAFDSGETQNIGLLAGSLAACYEAAARRDEARRLRRRALDAIASADLSFWLLDQLAVSPIDEESLRARRLLVEAARDGANLAARAHLALFDARVARRRRRTAAAKALAAEAAQRFAVVGWPWERAAALELAGRPAEAHEIYAAHGYARQLRELDVSRRRARHRAGRDRLTPREREVANLAAAGLSNREIGERLFIGERTVETHVAAMFDRFDLTSRRQFAALLQAAAE